jgi:hypothetical protein
MGERASLLGRLHKRYFPWMAQIYFPSPIARYKNLYLGVCKTIGIHKIVLTHRIFVEQVVKKCGTYVASTPRSGK